MKNIGIAILMMGLLMGLSLGIDILQGFDISTALRNAFNPFLLMEVIELFILFLFIFTLLIKPVLFFFQKRKEQTSNPQSEK
ncbi:hypothetical protein C0966_00270 [Bacillus methanolicus]|uniref:hypothetical protein n=1 Tax=Bacillus methanolicus TaxID=1471 RepID=UPI0023807870|nr:hypothetical protein [Bacillus methanolicus]MDE3837842.1 hypothetical protein [Bacillus methanolicus]